MDSYYNTAPSAHHQNNVNKVYINPNFARASTSTHHTQMHVNPNYMQLPKVQSANKIFVNRKFIKPNYSNASQFPSKDVTSVSHKTIVSPVQQTHSNTPSLCSSIPTQTTTTSATTSRYCIVRHHAQKEPQPMPILPRDSNTYKVNKYKSVSLNDIKRKLNKVSSLENQALPTYSTNKTILPPVIIRNSTAIVIPRRSQLKLINSTKQELRKLKLTNIIVDRSSHLKVRKIGSLKKNNIPCPLFKKYGTCLRMSRGKCEFLHDRNHVSICRRFVKGICHDKACLLSHDLTTKKMPTCHFYLQGICTKEGCPYLHVKLNENTKICTDFLKGYCDKGSKCLLRHIQPDTKQQATRKTKARQKNKHLKIKSKEIKMKQPTEQQKITSKNVNTDSTKNVKQSIECRYYQESNEENKDESFEVIKPTRCKLGLLPSFIQL